MKRSFFTASLVLVTSVLPACADKDPFDGPLDIGAPVATRSSLAYVDHRNDELIFVSPGSSGLDVRRRPLGDERDRALWCVPTRNGEELLVLTGPVDAKQEDVDETLHRYAADGRGDPVDYDVLAPFNTVARSPDLRRAILYFAGNDASIPLQNANQVSIVDLEGEGVRNLTLNGFGGRLTQVQFPGQIEEGVPAPIQIGPFARDIAAFLAPGEVVLVDMDDAEADQVAVRFDEAVSFSPQQTLLRPGTELFPDPALFLRSNASPDVAMLTLIDKPDETTGLPGFSAQVSLVPVGTGATDFVFHDEGDVPYLITMNRSAGDAVFTDIRTQESFEVDMEGDVEFVFLRDHDTGDGFIRQAVVWSRDSFELHTLDLDGIASTIGRKPDHLKIETGVEELVVLDNDRVLIGSGLTLYVVDFPANQVTPLDSQSQYDPRSSALDGGQLHLGTSGSSWVSTVDLVTLNPESMLLDDPIRSFHFIGDAGRIMVVHDDPIGHVTVIDAEDPARSTSYSSWGFLLENFLEVN